MLREVRHSVTVSTRVATFLEKYESPIYVNEMYVNIYASYHLFITYS